ncbi:GNAT family N-acetyltransferase [Mobilitalea sibirica]|uniref:GNAT family N-acetyltransferase n=1 Tax=Mobilitalea sibirica TaxID=1462919 RepID=A0A8J7H1J7_9FIRM|nr:GNAT family N-acetyltransferase [Mobilitalea sibirica]MBH1940288.1 GNAT family N-acetyltransferase [Mobilitalea sibirica]
MVVKVFDSAKDYLNAYEEVLLEQEAVSQLILYNAHNNLHVIASENCMFGVVLDDEKVPLLHFSNVTPKNMAIYAGSIDKERLETATVLLAKYLSDNHISLTGLNARFDICQSFLGEYVKMVKCTFVEKLGMDIMEVREVNDIKPVEGVHRTASMEEVKLIADWMVQFQIEALANEINYEAALEKTKRYIEDGRVYIYENMEQKVVSMAIATRQLMHGVAISYVFTPEDHRGTGYAAANIYYMSKDLLEKGNEFCTLFVDKKNVISIRAYEKVGYHILEDNYEYQILYA